MMGGNSGMNPMFGSMPPGSNLSLPPSMSASNDNMDSGPRGRKRGLDRDYSADKKAKVMMIRDPESPIMRSIFVGNLDPLMTADELKDYFSSYGNVANVDLRKKPNSDRNKGACRGRHFMLLFIF